MWWSKTRDLVVETCTIVKGIEKKFEKFETDFENHEQEGVKKYDKICEIIKECHESCPESDNFQQHINDQNGTLKNMDKKADAFYKKHDEMEHTLEQMKTAKKTKKEMFTDIAKVVTIVCIILGAYFAWQKHCDAKKGKQNTRIETMLEKLLDR